MVLNRDDLDDVLTNAFEIVEHNHKTYIKTPIRKDLIFLNDQLGIKAIRIGNGIIIIEQ